MTSFITDAPLDPIYAEYVEAEQQQPVEKKKKRKKLTKAERMELELKREREFKMLEMRDQMKREYAMSKKTERKYRERWEAMCREIKLKEMKKELEEWEKKVNRVMQQKDEKIERILDEIATVEEIHQKSFSGHLQMMDYLIDVLKTLQQTSHTLYEKEASEMLHDFFDEVETRTAFVNSVKLNVESVTHASHLIAEQEMLSDFNIFLDKRDDRVNNEIVKRYKLRDAVVKKMKDLRQQLLEYYNSVVNVSLDPQKYERINSLMERQRNFMLESRKLDATEKASTRIYADLQRSLAQEERDFNRKHVDLNVEHNYFMKTRKRIENEMEENREETQEKLKIVASESFTVLKKFQKLHKFGELLLSLAANCRKFQTQSEKVVPWGDFQEPMSESEVDNEPFQLQIIDLKDHVDISEAELQKNGELMKNFWRRQAIAEAEVLFLEEKKLRLLEENQSYIKTIKSLSKTDNAEDLKETLQIKNIKCSRN